MEQQPLPRLRATISWIVYDFANTMFSMNVVSMYFPTLIVVDLALGDQYVSFANSLSMIFVALTLPLLGEISDRFHKRMPFLIAFTLICIVFTAMIGVFSHAVSDKLLTLGLIIICYMIANYAYQGGLVFYNALLPHVCSERSMGRVSGYGVALGYLGSILGLTLVLPFVEGSLYGFKIPFIQPGGSVAAFIPTAVLFLLFSLPIFFFVKDSGKAPSATTNSKISIKTSLQKVWEGLSNTRKYPGVTRFLIAKFFYEDAIQTVIIFMAVYAQKVMGFSKAGTTQFFIAIIPSAIVGSALFGIITDHFGPKKTLTVVLSGWVVCLLVMAMVMKLWAFWTIGALIGVFMGSTWTSARPLLISLVPRDMLGEFFGLYSFSGKLAAIFGPLVWAVVVNVFAQRGDIFRYKAAMLSLNILIIIGLIILQKVPDLKKTQV